MLKVKLLLSVLIRVLGSSGVYKIYVTFFLEKKIDREKKPSRMICSIKQEVFSYFGRSALHILLSHTYLAFRETCFILKPGFC